MNVASDYLRELRQTAVGGWNRFWFTPVDPATLGLIRLFTGAMLLYTHLVWSLDLGGFFGPTARLTEQYAQAVSRTPMAWSYLYWIDSLAWLWVVHIAALLVLLAFMLGLFSRMTSVLAFIITVAYAQRANGALFGLDQINALLAMYLMIGPSGAAYSLDRLIARWRAGGTLPPAAPSAAANLAVRLIQVHMCIVYLFAGTGKLLGPAWWDGTAMWMSLANYEYQSLDVTWLGAYPLLLNFLTHLTVAWECSYIFLVWPRLTRPLVLALAIPLHLGIAFCMGMITFALVMLIGNLAFVSPQLVRACVEWPLAKFTAGRETTRAGQGSA